VTYNDITSTRPTLMYVVGPTVHTLTHAPQRYTCVDVFEIHIPDERFSLFDFY